jgi:hypothetical protein
MKTQLNFAGYTFLQSKKGMLSTSHILYTAWIFILSIALFVSSCQNATDADANRVVNQLPTENVATMISTPAENTMEDMPVNVEKQHTVVIRNTSTSLKVRVTSIALESTTNGVTLGTLPTLPLVLEPSGTVGSSINIPVTVRPLREGAFTESIILNGDKTKKHTITFKTNRLQSNDTIPVNDELEVINITGTNTSTVQFFITDPTTGNNVVMEKIRLRNKSANVMRISGMELQDTQLYGMYYLRYDNQVISKPPFPEVLAPNESITLAIYFNAPTNLTETKTYETLYRFYTRSEDSTKGITGTSKWSELKGTVSIVNNPTKNIYVEPIDSMAFVKQGTVTPIRFQVRNQSDKPAVFNAIELTNNGDLVNSSFSYITSSSTTITSTPYTIAAGEVITVVYNCVFKMPPQPGADVTVPMSPNISPANSSIKVISPTDLKLWLTPQ